MAASNIKQKIRVGKVVSIKMDKTAVIEIERKIKHPKYIKTIKLSKKFKLHDEKNECKLGDIIKMVETRPISKDKNWKLLEIVEKGVL